MVIDRRIVRRRRLCFMRVYALRSTLEVYASLRDTKFSLANNSAIVARVGIGTICRWLSSNLYFFGKSETVDIGCWKRRSEKWSFVEKGDINIYVEFVFIDYTTNISQGKVYVRRRTKIFWN